MPETRFTSNVNAPARTSAGRNAIAVFALFIAGMLAACATPTERARSRAAAAGFERQTVSSAHFEHVLYVKPAGSAEASPGPLHVYIEGDASPLRSIRQRPIDPTPKRPLMLELMALDPAPSLYLGRPAQHGTASEPWDWTLGRYSQRIVESMVAVLNDWNHGQDQRKVVLIGFSGGGTLAMLMANDVEESIGVVTLGGNLDVGAWARHHGHHPLVGSLDPALLPPLAPELFQLHLLAGRDRSVPGELVAASIERQPGALTRRFPDFDHTCCWERAWSEILEDLPRGESLVAD